ncbi:MAG: amino acid adenylation domain-containing protein [Actinomycetota bacterium]|nr:amino acid adenylation domain-containing protein [Actinomycetota bacterium]
MSSAPGDDSIAARFARQTAASPDSVAVVDGEGSWSYRRIAEEAATLATQLARSGAAEHALIGLSVGRGWRVVAGILAIWSRRCAYVPIDPGYPEPRRQLITADARLSHIITDAGRSGFAVTCAGAGPAHIVPQDTAYVIYTSGSTGRPKGVIVRHGNVLSLLDGAACVLPADPADAGTVFHSYCFDFSVWEIWRMLTAGGRCVFVPAAATLDGNKLARLLAHEHISVLNLVPSVFANLVRVLGRQPVALPRLRQVIFGGEPLNIGAVRTWYELGAAPAAELINMYGITETTVHVTARRLNRSEMTAYRDAGTPIGRSLPHLRVAVLDEHGQPVPSGSTGEMYVAGSGVSAGYLDRPGLTAARFSHLPFDGGGSLWYRTGDLARLDPSGELTFLGRADDQVQLRGHRIELGEIEAAVRSLPGVADAAATLMPNGAGEPVLVACYVPAGSGASGATTLRDALFGELPRYMVPARLEPIAKLPVTPEGKLDRAALQSAVRGLPHDQDPRSGHHTVPPAAEFPRQHTGPASYDACRRNAAG